MVSLEEKINEFKKWHTQRLSLHQNAIAHFCELMKNIHEFNEVSAGIKSVDECKQFQKKAPMILNCL